MRCVPVSGQDAAVRLLVVPRIPVDVVGRLGYDDLRYPSEELVRRIAEHLDRRRLIGTRLVVEPPAYRGVTVVARLGAREGFPLDDVRDDALRALYGYLSPLDGGADGQGWPFGRAVQAFDVSAVLSQLPGVAQVEEVLLFPADPATGERSDPVARVEVAPNALVFSYQHQVRVQ